MNNPTWFSRRYPTLSDLESLANDLRTKVVWDALVPGAYIVQVAKPGWNVIVLPTGLGLLDETWQLAHELGHLMLHPGGYISEHTYQQQEARANAWAARALIPEAAIRRHRNASLDAFIAALSRHYQDLPYEDCQERRLAAEIAAYRLRGMEVVA